MTYEEIAEFYRSQIGIKRERTVKVLAENTRFYHRNLGDRIRVAGNPLKTILFRLNGVARAYVHDDTGTETVLGFCHEPGGPCLGAIGIEDTISINIDCVTEMDILEIPVEMMHHTMRQDPQIAEIVQRLLIEDHQKDVRRQIATQNKSGEERYRWFLEEYGSLVGVVTQKDIASFLGLRPQSLSRIKVAMEKEAAER